MSSLFVESESGGSPVQELLSFRRGTPAEFRYISCRAWQVISSRAARSFWVSSGKLRSMAFSPTFLPTVANCSTTSERRWRSTSKPSWSFKPKVRSPSQATRTAAGWRTRSLASSGRGALRWICWRFSTPDRNFVNPSGALLRILRALWARIQNFPSWVRENVHRSTARALLRRMATRLRLKVRRLIKGRRGERMNRELVEVAEIEQLPPEFIAPMSRLLGAVQSYQPDLYPGRVTLIRASTRRLMCGPEPDLGWGRFAEGGVDLRIVSGFHGNLLADPAVRAVSQELNQLLRARASRPGDRR